MMFTAIPCFADFGRIAGTPAIPVRLTTVEASSVAFKAVLKPSTNIINAKIPSITEGAFSKSQIIPPAPLVIRPIVPPPVDSTVSTLIFAEAAKTEKFIPRQVTSVPQTVLPAGTKTTLAGAAANIRQQKNTILVGYKDSDSKILYYEIINQ